MKSKSLPPQTLGDFVCVCVFCFRANYGQRLRLSVPIVSLTQAHCGNYNYFTSQ